VIFKAMRRRRREARERQRQRQVCEALDAVYSRTVKHTRELELTTDRLVIFSDLHRGARNGADDFVRSERAFNAAMAWYYRLGYTLVVLGDVEELWEEAPNQVIDAYTYSMSLEAKFHRAGRYVRVWGNHDDEWQFPDAVRQHLQPLYGQPRLEVLEALPLQVKEAGEQLGTLFLVHGHQGTSMSDRWTRYSRLVVRYLYRPFQRLTNVSLNTPSENWLLRDSHNIALHTWATAQERLVLVAGHTHRPVFESRSRAGELLEALAALEEAMAREPENGSLQEQAATLAAELEWYRAQEMQRSGPEEGPRRVKPCYFNTGCCCYSDGDITGIEIEQGEIRLVRWPDDAGRPQPRVLERDLLKDVLARC
jgi:predicted phosphodiesterase